MSGNGWGYGSETAGTVSRIDKVRRPRGMSKCILGMEPGGARRAQPLAASLSLFAVTSIALENALRELIERPDHDSSRVIGDGALRLIAIRR